MIQKLAHVCILVKDYDQALSWYIEKLGFEVRSDQSFGPNYRWLTIGLPGQDVEIILHKVDKNSGDPRLHQAGLTTGWVLHTDHCIKESTRLKEMGVKFSLDPEEAPWGTQAVFEDLYGNSFVLLEPRHFSHKPIDAFSQNFPGDPTEQ